MQRESNRGVYMKSKSKEERSAIMSLRAKKRWSKMTDVQKTEEMRTLALRSWSKLTPDERSEKIKQLVKGRRKWLQKQHG